MVLNRIFLAAVIALSVQPGWAESSTAPAKAQEQERPEWFDGSLRFGLHQQQAEFSWNTAADISGLNTPNILSELTFDDLQLNALQIGGDLFIGPVNARTYLEFEASYGQFTDGQNRDSDYLGDNRSNEFSRSQSTVDNDEVFYYGAALGAALQFLNLPHSYVIALLGYTEQKQNFRKTDGIQIINSTFNPTPLGPFDGLDTTYAARWRSPWAGIQLTAYKNKHGVTLRYEYHGWADYYAQADWNLRTDLQHPRSFVHDAEAEGYKFRLAYHYWVTPRWRLNIALDYEDWTSDPGVETRFFADQTLSTTRLNRATWESTSFGADIAYQF